jgi:hypothetical protein
MKKVDYITGNVTVKAGSTQGKIDIDIPKGKIIRGVIFYATAPSQEVDIFIKDSGNNVIVPATNHKDWLDGQGGPYLDRKKPLSIESKNGNKTIKVFATSEVAQTADFNFQILFVVDQSSEPKEL